VLRPFLLFLSVLSSRESSTIKSHALIEDKVWNKKQELALRNLDFFGKMAPISIMEKTLIFFDIRICFSTIA
jgi:hypothetical protein